MPVFNYHLLDREDPPEGLINIMRPNFWSNRFRIGPDGDRQAVLLSFRTDLSRRVESGEIPLASLAALDGANLLCCCTPNSCHGDILLEAARWAVVMLAARPNARGALHLSVSVTQ